MHIYAYARLVRQEAFEFSTGRTTYLLPNGTSSEMEEERMRWKGWGLLYKFRKNIGRVQPLIFSNTVSWERVRNSFLLLLTVEITFEAIQPFFFSYLQFVFLAGEANKYQTGRCVFVVTQPTSNGGRLSELVTFLVFPIIVSRIE